MQQPVNVNEHAPAGSAGVSANSVKSKLPRYSLRSATKSSHEKPNASDLSSSAASKRVKPTSSVSKSVGVLDLSGKGKSGSAKPPRRLSIPAKASAIPGPKQAVKPAHVSPISEARTNNRLTYGQNKSETPTSDISRPSSRKKFNALSSASFWLSQIKVSESASKHSISLGFFKLALEAVSETQQHVKRMQDELKSYVQRHQLAVEQEELLKELIESYNISENTKQLQNDVTESVSEVREEASGLSDEDLQNSSSIMSTVNMQFKCLNIDSTKSSSKKEPTKKETCQKSNNPRCRVRGSFSENSANSRSGLDSGSRRAVKKPEKPGKEDPNREKGKIRKQPKKPNVVEGPASPSIAGDKQGNKENLDTVTS